MNIIYMSLIAVFITIFTGCSSKEPVKEVKIPTVFDSCVIEGEKAPEWVCGNATAQNSDQIYDIGVTTISKLGIGFTQKEATAQGVIKLQKQLEELAQEKIILFMRRSEIDMHNDIDMNFVNLISQRVSEKVVGGARVSEYWKNYYLNRAYVQVVVKKSTFKQSMQREVLLEIRQKAVYWEEYKNRNAGAALEKVLSEI